MPRTRRSLRSPLARALTAAVGAAAAAAVVGTLVVAPTSPAAQAVAPRVVTLEALRTVAPGNSSAISGMAIDSTTNRGYVIDHVHETIEAYDLTGDRFGKIATIALPNAVTLAVDEAGHRLYVGLAAANVAVIDVDPDSSTVNTVVKTLALATSGQEVVAGAGDEVIVGNASTSSLAFVNAVTGSVRTVALPSGASDIEVDRSTGVVYVTTSSVTSVTVVQPDGSTGSWPVAEFPRHIAVGAGRIFVTTEGMSGEGHLETLDSSDGTTLAPTITLPAIARDLAIDRASGLVMAAHSTARVPNLTVYDAGTLAEVARQSGAPLSSVSVNTATQRFFTSETNASDPAHVTMMRADSTPVRGVDRIGGADRYEVSAAVSADTFSPGVAVAYVASGAVFPDALSGSAAAGLRDAPVLLVTRDSVPATVAAELDRLRPRSIVVLGGPATISAAVETALAAFAPAVTRVSGADRYEVSAELSRETFSPKPPVVYLASGLVFPDALSGSAAAGFEQGPVLLTTRDRIPAAVAAELDRLEPDRIVVLGGTATVADSVLAEAAGRAPVSRVAGADRFEVSARVSAETFPAETETVYVASGAVFPDALSGSAAAIANGAPVLLVQNDAIPPSVKAELERIRPTRIVVLGGPATISPTLEAALESYLTP
ncbi:cell wall-binding repeat-containing protein [Herbiconiux liukaitaii]|uniref:cell wall-binding repeat-containing protein n=1 Tax=Herbiconiux liukaitaii TaxID=3342799 RepID=UPI0035B7C0B3